MRVSSGICAPADDYRALGFGHSLGFGYLGIGHSEPSAIGTIVTFPPFRREFRVRQAFPMGWGVDFFATIGMDDELSPERGGNHETNIHVFGGRRRGLRLD